MTGQLKKSIIIIEKEREENTMYFVEWYDKELDEILTTTTNEKGLHYLKTHPDFIEIIFIKEEKEG